MVVKLDISKPYNRVEWGFLRGIMLKLGFDQNWEQLAMETTCMPFYSMLNNGEPNGFRLSFQEDKKKDPLLPYLLLLCAEDLLALLRKAEENHSLHGILSSSSGVRISRLLFADDNLLFCQGSMAGCINLMNLLQQYEEASGQAIKRQKTSFFFSKNTHPQVKMEIQSMLGARIMSNCEKYLGLPMVGGKLKMNTFRDLQERITKRMMRWKETYISKACREVLIKTVAQVIHTYSRSLFKLPMTLCNTINATLAKYWWGQTKDEKKKSIGINWRKLLLYLLILVIGMS